MKQDVNEKFQFGGGTARQLAKPATSTAAPKYLSLMLSLRLS